MAHDEVVVAPLVIAKDERGRDLYAYKGQPVPEGQSDEWLDRHRTLELIGPPKEPRAAPASGGRSAPKSRAVVDDGAFVDDGAPDQASGPERPHGNAGRDAWHEFALAAGRTEDELEGLGRDEIRALFAED